MSEPIKFECPSCGARHCRGYVDYVALFRCLRCGYQGYGFHPDPEIDRAVYLDHRDANVVNRTLGIPEVPVVDDPEPAHIWLRHSPPTRAEKER